MQKKVLIVDSNIENIKLYGAFLTKQMFDVLVATSTKQAILIAEAKTPDIIITEFLSPQINGFIIFKVLKKEKKTSTIPFVFFTEVKDKLITAKINKIKGGDSLSKPFSTDELLIKLNSYFNKNVVSKDKMPPADKKRTTIMVVDDIAINRNLIEDMLSDLPVEILKSSSGKDSLNKIKENKIDLILLDIEMPGMDGWQTINQYKKLKINIPILALSAHSDKEFEERCKREGFKSSVSKPISAVTLKYTIEKYIGTKLPKQKSEKITEAKSTKPSTKKLTYIAIDQLLSVTQNDLKLRRSTYKKFCKTITYLYTLFLNAEVQNIHIEDCRKNIHSFVNLTPYFCKKEIVKKAKAFEQQIVKPIASTNSNAIHYKFALFLGDLKQQLESVKV